MQRKVISTVVSAAKSYDLTTLDVVNDELSQKNNANAATLKRYLSWASAALSQACNRVFAEETIQDQLWPARDTWPASARFETLQLSRWPVSSIVSLTEDGVTLVEDTDFVLDPSVGQLSRINTSNGHLIHWNARPKVIQFVAGFSSIPGDLQDACTRMVRNRFQAKGRDSFLMQETIPGVRDARWWIATGNEAGNVPPDIEDLIDNYRVPVVA
jgi:hypothetical protein